MNKKINSIILSAYGYHAINLILLYFAGDSRWAVRIAMIYVLIGLFRQYMTCSDHIYTVLMAVYSLTMVTTWFKLFHWQRVMPIYVSWSFWFYHVCLFLYYRQFVNVKIRNYFHLITILAREDVDTYDLFLHYGCFNGGDPVLNCKSTLSNKAWEKFVASPLYDKHLVRMIYQYLPMNTCVLAWGHEVRTIFEFSKYIHDDRYPKNQSFGKFLKYMTISFNKASNQHRLDANYQEWLTQCRVFEFDCLNGVVFKYWQGMLFDDGAAQPMNLLRGLTASQIHIMYMLAYHAVHS